MHGKTYTTALTLSLYKNIPIRLEYRSLKRIRSLQGEADPEYCDMCNINLYSITNAVEKLHNCEAQHVHI